MMIERFGFFTNIPGSPFGKKDDGSYVLAADADALRVELAAVKQERERLRELVEAYRKLSAIIPIPVECGCNQCKAIRKAVSNVNKIENELRTSSAGIGKGMG